MKYFFSQCTKRHKIQNWWIREDVELDSQNANICNKRQMILDYYYYQVSCRLSSSDLPRREISSRKIPKTTILTDPACPLWDSQLAQSAASSWLSRCSCTHAGTHATPHRHGYVACATRILPWVSQGRNGACAWPWAKRNFRESIIRDQL